MSFITTGPHRPFQEHELHMHLFLHQIGGGSAGANQKEVVGSKAPRNFGAVGVEDWDLRDGRDPNSKLIARAQGMYCFARVKEDGGCYNSFCIVFEEESGKYKGSTLQVMAHNISEHQAAIIGGTGLFAMARGVVYKKRNKPTQVHEFDIRAIYVPMGASSGNAWTLK